MEASRGLRVLHLIPSLASGGAERQLILLSRAQAQRGHEVHVVVPRRSDNTGELDPAVLRHELLAAGNHDPRLILQVAALARVLRPHVIQSWLLQMDVVGGIVTRALAIPWVLTERSCAAAYTGSVKARIRSIIARGSAVIVSNSRGGDAYWRDLCDGTQLRQVIPNGLDLAALRQLPAAADLLPDAPLILFGGRLAAEKNVDTLLHALARVLRRSPGVALLCGNGPDRQRLEQQARALDAGDRLVFTGHRPDLVSLMKRAAVFVAVSRFEGHPNAVIEAMAVGCPLVLSRIPAHTEILDDDAATFVDPTDAADIARGIEAVLLDPQAARRRVEIALARAQAFSINRTASAYDELYHSLLAHRRSRRTGSISPKWSTVR